MDKESSFDEAIDVEDAEDVPSMSPQNEDLKNDDTPKVLRPYSARMSLQLQQMPDPRANQIPPIDSEISDDTDEDDDDEDVQAPMIEGAYDPKEYEHLPVSSEIKELFQYITYYTPQTIQLDYKLIPFIPDYIPAVGDIDGFLKVPRPDGKDDRLGLVVLDEPCAKQTEPAVMHLHLRASAKQSSAKPVVVKKVEHADKNPKEIERWMRDIKELHKSKPPPTVQYSRPMPDIDNLMQAWPPEFEQKLNEIGLPLEELETDLPTYIDIILALFDIPRYESRIESLHVLFSLYSAIKNYKKEANNSSDETTLQA